MAIFGIIAIILALIFPIGIIALIIYLVTRKKSNNEGKKDDFEKVIRTVYTYILVLAFLIASVGSFISAVDTMADYLLPEEEYTRYDEDDDYRREVLNKQNDKNQMAVNMITNFATVVICVPMFVYHMNLTKNLIKKEK